MAERAFHDPADHHEVPKLVPSTEEICKELGGRGSRRALWGKAFSGDG